MSVAEVAARKPARTTAVGVSGPPGTEGMRHQCCGEPLRPFWGEDGRYISVCRVCGTEHMDKQMIRFGGGTWIGVDLDGTLARDLGRPGSDEIGEPVQPMLDRVKQWLAEGKTVKIFTARASVPSQIPLIKQWLSDYGLPDLEVTNSKDFGMTELWDDRCVAVAHNTGEPRTTVQRLRPGNSRSPLKFLVRKAGRSNFMTQLRMYLAL
jgi:hypothetical protein